LFDAEWIVKESPLANVRRKAEAPHWRRVDTDAELFDWERRWATLNAEAGQERLFTPELLSKPDIAFVLVLAHDAPIGGGVFNRGGGAVGISNLFASPVDVDFVWRGLLDAVATIFPGTPIVGYDNGEQLVAALRVGFATIGPLRIWSRPPSANRA
jgi:hypothetical protein